MIAIVTNLRSICERHRSTRVNISRRLTFCSLTGYSRQSRGVKNFEKSSKNSSRPLCTSAKRVLSLSLTKKLTFQGVKVPFAANLSSLSSSIPFFLSVSLSLFSFLFAVFSSLFEGSGVTKVIDLRGASPGPPRTSNQRHIFQRIRAASKARRDFYDFER